MSVFRKYILLIFLLLSFSSEGQDFSVKVYHTKEGLPGNNVQSILQDSRGYLWVSTEGGLSRFDGSNFKNYGIQDGMANYFPSNTLIEDGQGSIWFSRKEGVCSFDGRHVKQYPVEDRPAYFWVTQVIKTRANKLWFVTSKGIYELHDTVWKKQHIINNGKDDFFNYIVEVDSNNTLINFKDSITICHKDGSFNTIARINEDNPIFQLTARVGNSVYVSTRNHLFKLNGNKLDLVHDDVLNGKFIVSAFEDNKHRLWVGTIQNGIFVFDENGYTHIDPTELNLWAINGFCQDHEDNIWVATSNGMVKITPSFVNIYHRGADATRCAYKDKNGRLYFGHVIGGFDIWDNSNFLPSSKFLDNASSNLVSHWIHSFAMDDRQRLWLVDNAFRLIIVQDKKAVEIDTKSNINSYALLYNAFDSAIYIGCEYGLLKINDGGYATDTLQNDRLDPVYTLSVDPLNNIWLATEKGRIFRRSGGHLLNCNKELGIDSVGIAAIRFTDQDNCWVATQGKGLFKFHRSETGAMVRDYQITAVDGLPNDFIVDIAFDKQKRMWVSTMSGLVSIQYDLRRKELNIVKYGGEEIPYTNLLNTCFVADNAGNIWLGTDNYIAQIRCDKIVEDTIPPIVHIENIQLFSSTAHWSKYSKSFNAFYFLPENVVLPYDQNNISIDFKAISFNNGSNIAYSYMIDGIDNDWVNIGNTTHLAFGKLTPGSYKFKLRAKKPNSSYSNTAEFSFVIEQPWWKTWWFITLIVAAFPVSVYFMYRYRLNNLLKVQAIRNKIASDLHDDIGSTLNSISIYSEVARQDPKNRDEALFMIGDSARKIIDSMSDIVWTINPSNDNFEKVIFRMKSLAYNLLRAKNIEYTFRADEFLISRKLSMEQRQNLYLVFKEALNNLIKYSDATYVSISLSLINDVVTLSIHDNGVGFDLANARFGNGLGNMQDRARAINGKLKIESKPGDGTKIELSLF